MSQSNAHSSSLANGQTPYAIPRIDAQTPAPGGDISRSARFALNASRASSTSANTVARASETNAMANATLDALEAQRERLVRARVDMKDVRRDVDANVALTKDAASWTRLGAKP